MHVHFLISFLSSCISSLSFCYHVIWWIKVYIHIKQFSLITDRKTVRLTVFHFNCWFFVFSVGETNVNHVSLWETFNVLHDSVRTLTQIHCQMCSLVISYLVHFILVSYRWHVLLIFSVTPVRGLLTVTCKAVIFITARHNDDAAFDWLCIGCTDVHKLWHSNVRMCCCAGCLCRHLSVSRACLRALLTASPSATASSCWLLDGTA